MRVEGLVFILLALPLFGGLINGMLGKHLPKNISGALGTGVIFTCFLIVLTLFNKVNSPVQVDVFTLLKLDQFSIQINFLIDHLSIWMALIITGIGTLIHLFSMGYMKDDEGYYKFFTYLNLFIFAMLLLVLGGNYLILFFGWEGVGICSFLLIGFHYSDPKKGIANSLAARKAFVMNRIGDAGLIFAIFMLLNAFGTLNFLEIAQTVEQMPTVSTVMFLGITLCLFLAATGKSAQIPLFTWLPDAMAGPTPVSALIHAATMVTAGIYLVARSNFLFEMAPLTKDIMLYVGVATSIAAAFMALRQNDIKKVLAYSTVSQLGLMVVALGLGAYTVAIFHVTTHAFFKALLFLGSGSVIHGMHHEQDIRKMGGLRKIMPITHWTFLIGTLAISGFPLLSGFFSKDEILGHLFSYNPLIYGLLMVSVAMTAIYMFRLYFLTFHGDYRGDKHTWDHAHESPLNMTIPLMILAVFSIFGGLLNLPGLFFHDSAHWLTGYLHSIPGMHLIEHASPDMNTTLGLMAIASLLSIGVLLWAFQNYVRKGSLAKGDEALKGWEKVSNRKLYWDEMYHMLFVKPVEWLGVQTQNIVEEKGIKSGIDGFTNLIGRAGNLLRRLQNGSVSSYLSWMVIGMILFVVFYLIKGN